jgi:hypothetical protein
MLLRVADLDARELAQTGEVTRRLEDRLTQVAHPQLLGQRIGVALVALRAPTLRDPGHHQLVDVGRERLVQPGTLQALLEDQVLVTRDHADRFDECLAVGLDREVLEPAPFLGNHSQRAARGVNAHPDVAFHRCLLSLGVVGCPTRGCPTGPGGTNPSHLGDLRRCPQTPSPYDLCVAHSSCVPAPRPAAGVMSIRYGDPAQGTPGHDAPVWPPGYAGSRLTTGRWAARRRTCSARARRDRTSSCTSSPHGSPRRPRTRLRRWPGSSAQYIRECSRCRAGRGIRPRP